MDFPADVPIRLACLLQALGMRAQKMWPFSLSKGRTWCCAPPNCLESAMCVHLLMLEKPYALFCKTGVGEMDFSS